MRSAGAERLRIADTVGILNPFQTHTLIKQLLAIGPGFDFEFHGHNDLGMATANTIAAIDGGARTVSVTVNGLGERAGNAALEEVVVAAKHTLDKNVQVDLKKIPELCRMVAEISGHVISPAKPITGAAVFSHESGIHCHGVLRNPSTYEPFSPQEIGRENSRIVLGKHSGLTSLKYALSVYGIAIKDDEARELLQKVREIASQQKSACSVEQLLGYVSK